MARQFIKRGLPFLLLIGLLALTITSAAAQSEGAARLRFVHAVPGAPAVDIFTNGQLTIQGLEFGQVSTYVTVPAGDHQLTVAASGTTTPLWEQPVTAASGSAATLVAVATNPLSFQIYPDDLTPLSLGKARFTAIHAIAGAPNVDIALVDGQVALSNLSFGQPAGTLDLPTNITYPFTVVVSGQGAASTLLTPDPVTLNTGTVYTLLVYGTPAAPEAKLLTAAADAPESSSGFVRLVHGVADAPTVDVYVNDALVAPALEYGDMTEHIAVPAGTFSVVLRPAGGDQDLLTTSLTVEPGKAATAAALGTLASLNVQVFADDIAGITPDQARLSLLNGIPDGAISATLGDGSSLSNNLPFGQTSAPLNIPPARQPITLAVTTAAGTNLVTVPALAFYGGVYYNLLATSADGQVSLIVQPTSLAQGIASAPGTGSVTIAQQPTVPPPPAAIEIQPTVVPPAQPAAVASDAPTARVLLDPGANLQLRQYPRADALSLGLAPSGAVLTVNGRVGGPRPPVGTTPDPNATPFVDPASALDPKADLPLDTWLNITYNTPDGGAITAWVNAQFLDVRSARGERQRLADLPLVPSNQPGEAVNTGVTPPPIPKDRVVANVFNLDPGVNLNIRRTPDTNGEVLIRVPNGTATEFLGLKEDRNWVFVRYTTPEGGTVTGWANTLYIQYTYNNRPIKLDEMDQRGLLVFIPDDVRGEISSGIAPAVIPTLDPIKDKILAEVTLDPGANLNLRRRPDAQSEVIVPVPSGSRMIVNGRTGDGAWLNVSFEGAEGWVAAQIPGAVFVKLTFNGQPYDLANVPVVSGETDVIAPLATSAPAAPAAPTLAEVRIPVVVNDFIVQMTGSPGGSADGLPLIFQGQEATLLFTDGTFSYIELPDTTRGWVPAGAVRPR